MVGMAVSFNPSRGIAIIQTTTYFLVYNVGHGFNLSRGIAIIQTFLMGNRYVLLVVSIPHAG
mgnify:CR=1 FL=1